MAGEIPHEEMQRRQKLAAMDADKCEGPASNYGAIPGTANAANAGPSIGSDPNPIRRMLQMVQEGSEMAWKAKRALSILDKHPEFTDLIWLIRSGLV